MKNTPTTLNAFIKCFDLAEAKEFEHMFVGKDKNNVLYMQYKINATLDLKCAQNVVTYSSQLNQGKPLRNLIFLVSGCRIDKEASHFSKSEEANKYTIADAIIVRNKLQEFLGNLYMNVGKPSRPTKLFTNIEEAKFWLSTI